MQPRNGLEIQNQSNAVGVLDDALCDLKSIHDDSLLGMTMYGGSKDDGSLSEKDRFLLEMENAKTTILEKEKHIIKLQTDLVGVRMLLDHAHREHLDAEKANEKLQLTANEIQAELQELKTNCPDRDGGYGLQQQRTPSRQSSRKGKQNRPFDCGSRDFDSSEELAQLQETCLDLQRKLGEKDDLLKSLRDSHEHLRVSHRSKEQNLQWEMDKIVDALELSERGLEEKGAQLKELEAEVQRFKARTHHLERKCATTEREATEKLSLLEKLQSRFDNTTAELSSLSNSGAQAEMLKSRLSECERSLAHETAQKVLAENAWKGLQYREEQLLGLEAGHRELQEQSRWKEEQFQALEDAHSKLRTQFQETKKEWEKERSAQMTEMELLQSNLKSKERSVQDLQTQLQMVHQALAHEESRRKFLELQAVESHSTLEQASAECEATQSAIETLRNKTSTEIGSLRHALEEKDRQIKELHLKHVQMEQDYQDLKVMEGEFQILKSDHVVKEREIETMKEKVTCLIEAQESLRFCMKEREEESAQEIKDVRNALDTAHGDVVVKEQLVKQLESELEIVKGALKQVRNKRAESDDELKRYKEQLEKIGDDAEAAKQALALLEEKSSSEKCMLLDSVCGKDKSIQALRLQICQLSQTIEDYSGQEETLLEVQCQFQGLQQVLLQRDAERQEFEKVHEAVVSQAREQEKSWSKEKEKVLMELQQAKESGHAKDSQLTEMTHKIAVLKDVVTKLEVCCCSYRQEVAENCRQAEKANEGLASQSVELQNVMKEAELLRASLDTALSVNRDLVQKATGKTTELESQIQKSGEEIAKKSEKITLLERKLKDTLEAQSHMLEHITSLKADANKQAGEITIAKEVSDTLEVELRISQNELAIMKAEMEVYQQSMQEQLSSARTQLHATTQQLDGFKVEKELFINDLDGKEIVLADVKKERDTLVKEKEAIEQLLQTLERRKIELLKEAESQTASMNEMCFKLDVAASSLAAANLEVKDLQSQVQNAETVSLQLHESGLIAQDLEEKLKGATKAVQDKEEKLAASEWAVQQLAMDVSKAKSAFGQKEREVAALQDQLSDVERQFRGKEGEIIEMECYLESALEASKSAQAEIERLSQQMQILEKGTAEWKNREMNLMAQIAGLENALEEKREALVVSELAIKRGQDLREVMEGAIESLKLQLAEEQKAATAQQHDMNSLCEELETAKHAASSSGEKVKELQRRLEQLEQGSEGRIQKFEATISEIQGELSTAHSQLRTDEKEFRSLKEDCLRFKEKSEGLFDLIGRKDCALTEMEAKFESVQSNFLQQTGLLERRNREIQFTKEQLRALQHQHESLQGSINKMREETTNLELSNESFEANVRKLTRELDALFAETARKSNEILGLKKQVEQMTVTAAEQGETNVLMAKLSEELQVTSQALQGCEGRLRNSQVSFEQVQTKLNLAQESLALKEKDAKILAEKLITADCAMEESQKELLQTQKALEMALIDIKEKTDIILSYLAEIGLLKAQLADCLEKQESGSRERVAIQEDLAISEGKLLECHKELSHVQESLSHVQLQLSNATEQLLFQAACEESLHAQLEDARTKPVSAMEENKHLISVNEEVEVKMRQNGLAMSLLQEALKSAEEKNSCHLTLTDRLQAELEYLRVEEVAASKENSNMRGLLDDAQKKAEESRNEILHIQEALSRSASENAQQNDKLLNYASLCEGLQKEIISWRAREESAVKEVDCIKIKLKDAESQAEAYMQQLLHAKEDLSLAKHNLLEERDSSSLLRNVEMEAEEWKKKAEAALKEADGVKSELAAMLEIVNTLTQQVEGYLKVEEMVEEWKKKAMAASEGKEHFKSELEIMLQTVHSLREQVGACRRQEESMSRLNQKLQDDLVAAQDEAQARKEKMRAILLQLECTQESEKDLLKQLQLQYQRVLSDMEDVDDSLNGTQKNVDTLKHGVILGNVDLIPEFQNELNVRSLEVYSGTESNNVVQIRADFVNSDNGMDTQNSTDMVESSTESLEREICLLRAQADAGKRETVQLTCRLEAALSDLSSKSIVLQQYNDQISSLKTLVKNLEQAKSKHDRFDRDLKGYLSNTDGYDTTVDIKGGMKKEEELNHYLELCDLLVRKNLRLEKEINGLQRKNRGLQKQFEMVQLKGQCPLDRNCKLSDHLLSSPDQEDRGLLSRKGSSNLLKAHDSGKGNVLGELDENALQGGRRTPVSPAPVQLKRAKRVKEETHPL